MKKYLNVMMYMHSISPSRLLILSMCVFSISLSVLRVVATGSYMFLFLNWNLILALIPLLLSRYMTKYGNSITSFKFGVILCCWLLFFPNSPYLLTDLFHLKKGGGIPLWYDLILILSYAWTALWIGFKSLREIEAISKERIGCRNSLYLIAGLLFVASFGVYLGRYQRWNTWDIVANPVALMTDISHRFVHPLAHTSTWGMTILLGLFLNLVYFTSRAIK